MSANRDSAYRVMVVDDSAVIRGLLSRALEEDPEIAVVSSVANGQMAVSSIARSEVEVVVLDIEMPVMDGLTALPKLLEARPGVQVVMASTLTRKNADISLKAMRAGAADYVTKPSSSSELTSADSFKRELVAKVKALGANARRRLGPPKSAGPVRAAAVRPAPAPRQVTLRRPPMMGPRALAIGSSTGGPQALLKVLGELKGPLDIPIFITQHMPATFTTLLAEHIARVSGRPAREASEGETVMPGTIYVAPGDWHMRAEQSAGGVKLHVDQSPPENFCRPSVDPMLRSLVQIYGSRLLTVILTGMGSDGLKGCQAVVAAGGGVVAQDEASSVVWGMPGAVATNGLCYAVLPLDRIADHLKPLLARTAA
ncbi:two-component system, chemotaxis family, response regulator CheB [Tistlia consotensis]|uniref:Protein-glutamate methylesterase/protein-glutamine glutaminase n=1 Tax=Tistlia consotensis USBA 355 TaxID=560819 RepID=A0A1Y6CTR7_9PROT|nr:chemotaxis response regulator protein-glutamate methylesterase [Tistlia consotensis]SMF76388.1 two-component system, chemotaxis family, response regulator CheB [Tistlia consotensis USBA 355]SNS12811.1 two-component system, chemotaxis family, response regulator CheB [Tistlia consotensis]